MTAALNPRAAYELWAETYPAEAHNPLMAAEQTIVTRILTHIRSRRALDVGTGSGRYLPILESRAPCVVGIDLSMAMLTRGKHHSGGPYPPVHRHRVLGDACCLPFPSAAFDLINASLMVGDVVDLPAWTREMARVLSHGGRMVYSDFHPAWSELGWERTFRTAAGARHSVAFTPHTIEEHLAALASAGFGISAIREPRLKIRGADTPVVAIFHAVKVREAAR
jgi:malonyl-CoA O-methyltransferase